MLRIEIDGELEERLRLAAARLNRTPEDCVRSSLTTFVEDCEESWSHRLQLSQPQDHVREADFGD